MRHEKTVCCPCSLPSALRGLLLSGFLLLSALLPLAQAQVQTVLTPDGTLGTAVTQRGTVHDITGGTRPGNGPNLFHSFERFSIGTNDTARFNGPTGIVNILSRVTGGQQSVIDGRLQSTIPGANLYLLNPSGVLFGPNALLDTSGSFHVSTADMLRFADGAIFSAHLGEKSTLTTASPTAFGFLAPTPAAIAVQDSALGVSEGKALSVVGGDIQIVGGQLTAPSGRVQIASVASPGEVLTGPLDMTPDLQANAFARLGSLTLARHALLNASGAGGGTVLIRSGRLLLDQSAIHADSTGNATAARTGIDIAVAEDMRHTHGAMTAGSTGAGTAGDIKVAAGSLHMDGALIGAGTFSGGAAGTVTVAVGTLTLANGSQLDSSTFGPGTGGTVRVTAADTLTLTGAAPDGTLSGIFANAQGVGEQAGDAGAVLVTARHIAGAAGAQISSSSFGAGRGGTVQVTAPETLTLTGTSAGGRFPSGIFAETGGRGAHTSDLGIVVQAGTILITDGAQISSNTSSTGPGGTVTVTATEALTISGQDPFGRGSGLSANGGGSNDAGRVTVVAPTLAVHGGALQAVAFNSGRGGDITLDVGLLTLTGGAQLSAGSSHTDGAGGTITVTAAEAVSLADNAQIDTSGAGGGAVVIQSGRLLVDQSTITANTHGGAQGRGLTLDVRESVLLTRDAVITAASFGTGEAGDIRITASSVRGEGNAFIGAGALTDGQAGDIRIEAGTLTLADRAVIDSSTFGSRVAGHVTVIAPTLELQGGRIRASTEGAGDAGAITVQAERVSLTEGGQIFSNTLSTGQGGTVTVTASEDLRISGPDSGLFSSSTGSANAGRVTISTPVLAMVGGQLQAVSTTTGSGGTIELQADRVMLSGAAQLDSSAQGTGRGGTVRITARDTLALSEQARIDVSGAGGGAVVIRGSTLLLDAASVSAETAGDVDGAGVGVDIAVTEAIRLTQGGAITTTSSGAGKAGDIRLTAGSVYMAGALIAAEAFDQGRAGDIVMHGDTLTLTAGAQISSTTTAAGQGGNIVLAAAQGMSIVGAPAIDNPQDLAGLFVGTFGRGHAGRVAITTPALTLEGFASIDASTFDEGNAGAVEVTADRVLLTEGGSMFNTTRGPGQGGTITIAARESLALQAGGRLVLSAFDHGNAGRVSIATPALVMQGGFIETTAESPGGNAGTIDVDADRMTLTEGATIDSSTRGAGRGGSISLWGGSLVMDGAFINALTHGDMAGGSIDIRLMDSLDMRNAGGILAVTFGAGRGGDIVVEGGQLTLTAGAEINGTTRGSGAGGNVTVTARNSLSIFGRSHAPLSLSGLVTNALDDGPAGRLTVTTPVLQMDDGVIQAITLGKGRAGDMQLNVGSLTLTGGAQISSSSGANSLLTGVLTGGMGQGGNVAITATDSITISGRLDGFPSGVSTEATGDGQAGHIALSTPLLHLEEGSISSSTTGDGRAGDIRMHVGRLTLASGAQIASASGNDAGAVGRGQGGEVVIVADEAIAISGAGSTISSNTFGRGAAGNISLSAATLRLDDAGTIEASGAGGRAGDIRISASDVTLAGGAALHSSATAEGPGGNVVVTAAELLSISGRDANGVGSGVSSGTLGSGVGGNIVLQAQRLELNDGGTISALSLGTGEAGNIRLQAGQTLRSRHGAVTAEAEQADGGNIELAVGSRVELRDSQITATVKTGTGHGGNITIDPQFVIMQGSQVRADAFGGPGGNVRVVAGVFLADPESQLSASSALGIDGAVDIQAPITSISGAVAPLPQSFARAAELLRDRCAERLRGGTSSRFVLGGRDRIPHEPGRWLPSALEPLSPWLPVQNGQMPPDRQTDGVEVWHSDNAAHLQVMGHYAPALWPGGLDVECAR